MFLFHYNSRSHGTNRATQHRSSETFLIKLLHIATTTENNFCWHLSRTHSAAIHIQTSCSSLNSMEIFFSSIRRTWKIEFIPVKKFGDFHINFILPHFMVFYFFKSRLKYAFARSSFIEPLILYTYIYDWVTAHKSTSAQKIKDNK